MNSPVVSIIIPVYNGADYLRDSINSALGQSYKNIEILVINDGSNDSGATESVALSYGSKIKYFSKKNGGVASALNLGIKKMSGNLFSWLSHDDIYLPNKIERQVSEFIKNHNENCLIYSDYFFFDKNRRPLQTVKLKQHGIGQVEFDLLCEQSLHGCSLLIPKAAFELIGDFNENLLCTQDYDLWLRMAREFHFVHVPEILVGARTHATQHSRSLQHEQEILAFYTKKLSQLDTSQLVKAFPIKDLPQALVRLSKNLAARGFLTQAVERVRTLASETLGAEDLKNFEFELNTKKNYPIALKALRNLTPFPVRTTLRRLNMSVKDPVNYNQLLLRTKQSTATKP